MDSGAPEKKSVRLNIYNQTFSLLVSGDPAEMEAAAAEVDDLMSVIARSGNMDATRVAILACLHLQDRVHSLETEIARVKSDVEGRSRQLAELLDGVVSE